MYCIFPSGITTYLIRNFLTAIVKLFSTRRNPDAAQKQQILDSASSVANVLLKHLEPIQSGELHGFPLYLETEFQQRILWNPCQ
jgi:hypothetical protein